MKYKKYIYIHTFAKNLLSSALASFSLRRRLPFWQISGDFRVKNGGILGAFRGMKMGGFGAVLRWSCSWFYGAGMEVFGQSIGGDFGRKKESFKGLIWCALGLDFWRCLGGILDVSTWEYWLSKFVLMVVAQYIRLLTIVLLCLLLCLPCDAPS